MKTLFISLLAAFIAAFAHTTPLFAGDKGDGPKHLHFEVEGVGFDMVFVDGGTFTMGATLEQTAPLDNERPLHEVKLSDYYIGETEVTQALWNAVTGQPLAHFSELPPCSAGAPSLSGRAGGEAEGGCLPVEDVSFQEVMGFIKMLQQKTAAKFCLPTEAQWEYAARGGKASRGYEYAGSDDVEEVAWCGASLRPDDGVFRDSIQLRAYLDESRAHTYPVAQKKPNELGLYDMSGNVAEWTADVYAPYTAGRQKNPKGPSYGKEHVFRGGCWYFGPWSSRVTQRQGAPSSTHYSNLGFRLALPKYYKM